MKEILEKFDFKNDEVELMEEIYEKNWGYKISRNYSFLEQAYKKQDVTTQVQFAILRALTYQESKEGYLKLPNC